MVETPWDEGLPGPKAVFEDARWYVRVQRGERRLAFNITWFEKGQFYSACFSFLQHHRLLLPQLLHSLLLCAPL